MSSHTDHCAVFARNVINDISVILDKHTSNNYYFGHKSDNKDNILSNEIPHSYDWSIIPTHSHNTLNSSLQCMKLCLSTCGFDRWFRLVLWRSCSSWPLAVEWCFILWWDLDHELNLRIKVRNRITEKYNCVSQINTSRDWVARMHFPRSFSVKYSLSLQQLVKVSRAGSASNIASHGKVASLSHCKRQPQYQHNLQGVSPKELIICWAKHFDSHSTLCSMCNKCFQWNSSDAW